MSNLIKETRRLLNASNKILLQAQIKSKALDLGIPEPSSTKSASLDNKVPYFVISSDPAGYETKYIENEQFSLKNASNKNNAKTWMTIRELWEKGGISDNDQKQNNVKNASQEEQGVKTWLMIRELYEKGGIVDDEDQNVKSASTTSNNKPDPTAFITTRNHLSDKMNSGYMRVSKLPSSPITNAVENDNIKSASSGEKPSYLVTRDHMFKGSAD